MFSGLVRCADCGSSLASKTSGKSTFYLRCSNAVCKRHHKLIREDKVHQIYSAMQVGQGASGMVTLNQSLLNLVQRKYIGVEEALGRCSELDEFRQMLKNAGIALRERRHM